MKIQNCSVLVKSMSYKSSIKNDPAFDISTQSNQHE
jgi:hypothetical protein